MAGTSTPIFPQTVKNWFAQLINATNAYTLPTGSSTSTTNLVSLIAGDTNGDKVESINVTSTDTSARDLVLVLITASNTFILGVVSIPATAGTVNNIVSVDILRNAQIPSLSYDSNGNKYLYVASGSTLYVGTLTQVTTNKTVDVTAQGGQF